MAAPLLQVSNVNMATVDAFWNVYITNMNIGQKTDLTMPITVKTVIGLTGINILQARFRKMIEAPVTVTENLQEGIIRIAPAHNLLGHDRIIPGAQKSKPRTSSKAKIARPPNAFILYRQHHHPLVKAEYPKLHNNQISVILGSQWKQESDANKAKFATLALHLKAKHLLEHPGYQYQPRKPSEKKRRQSRKLIETTSAAANQDLPALLIAQSQAQNVAASNLGALNTQATQPPANALPAVSLAATASSSSTVPLRSLSSGLVNPSSSNANGGSSIEISKTGTGNAVFELGGEDINDEQFAMMLAEYNKTVPPASTQQTNASRRLIPTPVLYNEPSEESQNDANFYSAMVDFDDVFANENMSIDEFFDFQAASLQSPKA